MTDASISILDALRWAYEAFQDDVDLWDKIDRICYTPQWQKVPGGTLDDLPYLLKSKALGWWTRSPY